MPRKPARKRGPKGLPWYRKFNDTWYMPKIDGHAKPILDAEGQPVKGQENRDRAYALWAEMVARKNAATKGLDNPLVVIFEEFLDHTQRHREKETYEDYRRVFKSFKKRWPDLTVADLSIRHIEAWFDGHPAWTSTTKWNYQTILQAALNWAAKPQGGKLIPYNPIRGAERPRKKSRGGEARVDDATHQALLEVVPWDFKQILVALRHTGTRPGNICRVTAKNFNAQDAVWVFDEHHAEPGAKVHKTFKRTGKALIVRLTPVMVELCKQLAEKYPTGPLFRTRRGRAWKPNYIEKRFRLWRKKLVEKGYKIPDRLYAYCYRHQAATNLLEAGEPDTQVAAFLGHKGTRVLHEHYSGITGKSDSVRDMLLRNVTALPGETNLGGGTACTPTGPGVSEAGPRPAQAEEDEGHPSAD
jgi:hypothetical protein